MQLSNDEAVTRQTYRGILDRCIEKGKSTGSIIWRSTCEKLLQQLLREIEDSRALVVTNNELESSIIELIEWPDFNALRLLVEAAGDSNLTADLETCELQYLEVDHHNLKTALLGGSESPQAISRNSSCNSFLSIESTCSFRKGSPLWNHDTQEVCLQPHSSLVSGVTYPTTPSQSSQLEHSL